MARLDWQNLLSSTRFSDDADTPAAKPPAPLWQIPHARTACERDFDRVLFAAPIRRLADKTQVFPLDPNTSIRTRLTHSHEVSNLSRSIGLHLAHHFFPKLDSAEALPADYWRNIPAMLATIGLVHDMGNPPFGHSGEDAISHWFKKKCDEPDFAASFSQLPTPDDFLKFEGNAHTLRLLTKLQVADRAFGLNLTMGALAATMKYTVGSGQADGSTAARKKYGFFMTERDIAARIFAATGLDEGARHPLAYIMEACDDIAYTVLDTEDMVKKQLVSFHDVMAYLAPLRADEIVAYVIDMAMAEHAAHQQLGLAPSELNDVSMQKFRVHAINAMVTQVIHAFIGHYEEIMHNRLTGDLLANSGAAQLRDRLKQFDDLHGYKHRSVLKLQVEGYNAIHLLMDQLWYGISQQGTGDPLAAYAYRRISENYRRQYETDRSVPAFYAQCRLLTDMVSGMTDSYTIELGRELSALARN